MQLRHSYSATVKLFAIWRKVQSFGRGRARRSVTRRSPDSQRPC